MKKFFAAGMAAVMMLGIFTGCSNSVRLSKFDLDVGDEYTFGKYHGEEIEWEVISRNFLVEEGKIQVQLYSRYVLDCQPFDEDGDEVSWAECSLREWLNNDFFKEAFSATEQKQIRETSYFNIYGDDRFLTDKVYLAAYTEYRFKPDEAKCKPTDYAEDQGVAVENGYAKYWGRDIITATFRADDTASTPLSYPMTFDSEGRLSVADKKLRNLYDADDVGIRPIICVEFKAPIERKDIEQGDIVTFGSYEKNPIEWVVTSNDKDGITLLSRYGLLDKRMDKGEPESFEETSLHDWLNDDFYNDSFTAKEKKRMVEFDNDDYVRLLSSAEVKECFKIISDKLYTGYTKAFYEDHPELADKMPNQQKIVDEWWLMDLSTGHENAFKTCDPVHLGRYADAGEERSVRPVIKISIS